VLRTPGPPTPPLPASIFIRVFPSNDRPLVRYGKERASSELPLKRISQGQSPPSPAPAFSRHQTRPCKRTSPRSRKFPPLSQSISDPSVTSQHFPLLSSSSLRKKSQGRPSFPRSCYRNSLVKNFFSPYLKAIFLLPQNLGDFPVQRLPKPIAQGPFEFILFFPFKGIAFFHRVWNQFFFPGMWVRAVFRVDNDPYGLTVLLLWRLLRPPLGHSRDYLSRPDRLAPLTVDPLWPEQCCEYQSDGRKILRDFHSSFSEIGSSLPEIESLFFFVKG